MAITRTTKIIQRRTIHPAGLPGYITKARPPVRIPRRETREEWLARLDEKEQERRELEVALAIPRPKEEGYAERVSHWVRMRTVADTRPHLDWKELAQNLRPKLTPRRVTTGCNRILLKSWKSISALKIPRRGKGYGSSFRFLAHYYRAFVRVGVPEEFMATIAADYDHEDLQFSNWFFNLKNDMDHFISWHEFSWCLFVYVRVFET